MLYVAFVKNKARDHTERVDLTAKSRKWWNEGGQPAGLKTVAFYSTLGTQTPGVLVFDATSHEDIAKLMEFWSEIEFDIHPAVDLLEVFRRQGMRVG